MFSGFLRLPGASSYYLFPAQEDLLHRSSDCHDGYASAGSLGAHSTTCLKKRGCIDCAETSMVVLVTARQAF